MLSLTELVTT